MGSLLSVVCSTQKRWQPQVTNKPKEIEPVCETTTLQYGKHQHDKRCPKTGRLQGKGGSERCLRYGPATGKTSEPNKVHLEELSLGIGSSEAQGGVGCLYLFNNTR